MKVLFMTMASPNGLFLKSIVFFICLVGIPAKGLAAMFKSEACVLSPSPFVHLNCGKEFVNIKDAIYSTACGDHACRVHRDNVKCKKGESHECWILVDQIPLVECGNYYSLFLEIHFDCVKELPEKLNSSSTTSPPVGMLPTSDSISNNHLSNSSIDDSAGSDDLDSIKLASSLSDFNNDGEDNPLNSSLTPVTATLHRGPLEIELQNKSSNQAHPKAINVDGGASTVSSDRWKMALIVFLLVLK